MANPIPITIRCDCGETHRAELGDEVECSCGRRYDTSTLPETDVFAVRRAQLRMKLYVTLGLIFVAGLTVIGFVLWGIKGAALVGPLTALVWFRLLGPPLRRHVFRGAGELPSWKLGATEP